MPLFSPKEQFMLPVAPPTGGPAVDMDQVRRILHAVEAPASGKVAALDTLEAIFAATGAYGAWAAACHGPQWIGLVDQPALLRVAAGTQSATFKAIIEARAAFERSIRHG